MNKYLAIVILILMTVSVSLAQYGSPIETVKSFHRYSNARSSEFNKRHVESRKQWYTPSLYRAFQEQLRKDAAQNKQYPTDKPFFGDGLDFAPLNEPCESNGKSHRRFSTFGAQSIGKSHATVEVKFAYPKSCTDGSDSIVYKVNLSKINAKWLIADWIYPDGSTLTQEMAKNKYAINMVSRLRSFV